MLQKGKQIQPQAKRAQRDFGHRFVLGDKDSQAMVVFNPSTQEAGESLS